MDLTPASRSSSLGIITKPSFNANNRKYFCCCGQCHLATAARLVLVISSLKISFHVIMATLFVTALSVFWWINFAICIPILICLAYGVAKSRQKFLLPFVVFNAIIISCVINLVLLLAIGLAANAAFLSKFVNNVSPDQSQLSVLRAGIVGQMLMLVISALIDARMAILIWRYRGFLIDRQRAFAFADQPDAMPHHFSVFSTASVTPTGGFENTKISKFGSFY